MNAADTDVYQRAVSHSWYQAGVGCLLVVSGGINIFVFEGIRQETLLSAFFFCDFLSLEGRGKKKHGILGYSCGFFFPAGCDVRACASMYVCVCCVCLCVKVKVTGYNFTGVLDSVQSAVNRCI